MEKLTLSQYANECTTIAREITEGCEGDAEQIQDELHEFIDQHQWIIYTYYNLQVLEHSKNENAYFDVHGQSPRTTDFSGLMAQLAYAAFEADVQEELEAALEWYKSQAK